MTLNTVEKFLLLLQHPVKGSFIASGIYVNLGMAGAIILDMAFAQKVMVEDKKVVIMAGKIVKDPIEAEVISILHRFKRPPSIRSSVNKLFGKAGKLKKAILKRMAWKGIIRNEHTRILGLIPYNRHYLINRRARNKLIQQLKESLLNKKKISIEDVVVFGLLEACRMHKVLSSDRDELKIIKKQLKEVLKENTVGAGLDDPIKKVLAAVMEAIVSSAVSRRHAGY